MQGFRRGRLRYRYAVGAVAVAWMLGVAGCSGGSDPAPSDSTTSAVPTPTVTSVSPTPSPSVSVPEAARAHTQEGGIEFAKYYATLMSDSYTVPSSAEVRALSLDTCGACDVIIESLDDYVRDGYRVRESRIELEGAQLSSAYTDAEFTVDVLGREKATDIVDMSGKVIKPVPETTVRLRLKVEWTADGWRTAGAWTLTP
ncbi:MAG: hypothetical protein KBB39_16615 [Phycicoccus sp.]|nr:hypothetical protein [Phycicoccus sp.]